MKRDNAQRRMAYWPGIAALAAGFQIWHDPATRLWHWARGADCPASPPFQTYEDVGRAADAAAKG